MKVRHLLTGVAGAATLIAVLTVVSRVLGFGRWLVQSTTVQASAVGDAYNSANLLPNIAYEVVAGGALAGAVIPLLAGPLARKIHTEVNQISSALLTWALAGLIPVAIAMSLLARPIATLLPTPEGADPAVQADLVTYFLLIFSPQIVLYGIGVVLTGILQAHKRFLAPALAPILSTLVVIASYVIFGALAGGLQNDPAGLSDASLAWLAWGTTAGVAVMALPLLIPVIRLGVRLRPTFAFPPGVGGRARSLALAGLGALLAQQASALVVMLLANSGGVRGTFTLFQWSQAVYWLPYAVLAVPLATAVYPRLAELASHEDRAPFVRMAEMSTRAVLATSFVGAGALIAVAPAVAAIFALRSDTTGMSAAMSLMAPGVVGLSLIFHVTRVLYTVDRNRAAVTCAAAGWLAVSGACAVGVSWATADGQDGPGTLAALGAGHALGMTVAAVALLVMLARAVRPGMVRGLGRSVAAGTIGALGGALLGRFATASVLDLAGTSLMSAVMAGMLGAIVAAGMALGAVAAVDRPTLNVFRRVRG